MLLYVNVGLVSDLRALPKGIREKGIYMIMPDMEAFSARTRLKVRN